MDKYQHILKQYWGYDDFRGIQREIIESIGAGQDTLGLMPTGGGKSITFQVPALSMPGVCIVITPLISLMKDQVDNLRRRGILAHAIYSGLGHQEIVNILDNCIYGDIKFLYVSPERLGSQFFQTKLRNINVSFITVDEAHCISQWGYDFRPAYLKISEIRKLLPGKAILALTATATPDVVEDIQKQLAFRDGRVFRMSFRRKNVSYIVRPTADVMAEITHILNSVSGSAIIYTMSRRRTKEISDELQHQGISADYYHAGLDIAVKTKRQQDWQNDTTRVIVATNAFGMGIDKPDVRLVIHADVPSAIEAYFQEAGRAGRDGKRSYAVLLTTRYTKSILKNRVSQSFPPKHFVRDVYEHLAYFYEIGVGMGRDHAFIFPMATFCAIYHYNIIETDAALKILTNAGYINYITDPDDSTRLTFCVTRDNLYTLTDLSHEEDNLISCMMRYYTGLFSEYVRIDEKELARYLATTPERVYMLLSELRRKHILKFIPPRTEPKIVYLIDRVDGADVKLYKNVYDDLQDVMSRHVNAMISYIEDETTCRQTQLVRYFGEKSDEDCGTCEVCIAKRRNANADDRTHEIKTAILQLLSDHQAHDVSQIIALPYPRSIITEVLNRLIEAETISSDSITVWTE